MAEKLGSERRWWVLPLQIAGLLLGLLLIALGALSVFLRQDAAAAEDFGATMPAELDTPQLVIGADHATPTREQVAEVEPANHFGHLLANRENPGCMASNGMLTVINKANPIYPLDYMPENLVVVAGQQIAEVAAASLQEMLDAAAADGFLLHHRSGFRSYNTQRSTHAAAHRNYGSAFALMNSARAGHSEHQSGLAVDLLNRGGHPCVRFQCFRNTPHADWLQENSWRFGWIQRYKAGQSEITGFAAEEWHFRFIGVEAAYEYHRGGFHTLEEFLNLPAAPDYLD